VLFKQNTIFTRMSTLLKDTLKILKPFLFDESLFAQTYLSLLNEKVWPRISRSVSREKLWYQQDCAPAHFFRIVRDWLNCHFPNQIICTKNSLYQMIRTVIKLSEFIYILNFCA
jgi:hypothetical protein